MESHIQIKFTTRQIEFAIPDSIYSVPETVSVNELNRLVNSILSENEHKKEEVFDFLLLGEIIRTSLVEHITSKDSSAEQVQEIEYFVKFPAPSPENSLTHNDWVSGIDTKQKWILSGCYDNTIHIWSLEGEHTLTIPGHTAPVKSVAWIKCDNEAECTFVSTSFDETVILWQWNQKTNSVECIHTCKGHARSVDCVAVSEDKTKFATGSYDQMLKIWSADDESEIAGGDDDKKRLKTGNAKSNVKTPLMTLSGHTDGVISVQWTDSQEIATGGLDCTLRIWDVELGGLKNQLNGSKPFLGISYSPLSKLIVSGSADRHVRLWDSRCKDGTLVKSVFSSHKLWVTSVTWSPVDEYQFISGSFDGLVKLWDTRSPKSPLFDISGHEDKVLAVDWSLKNYIISGGSDRHVKIYKFKESLDAEAMES